MVGVSYRLTPENGERLLAEFAEAADDLAAAGVRFAFGGTPPVAERARAIGFFEQVFDGSELTEDVLAYLRGQPRTATQADYPQTTVERIAWKAPYPLIRHHFGLPTLEATLTGIEQIADARVLDVISLGIDQDAQENFFHPERQDPRRRGAGGVPVRNADDYRSLYAASRRGNYPLMRTYSGTDDFVRLAEMYVDTIDIAWAAVPLFWFNAMDGRGPHDLETSIRLHQELMAWYGARGIPVELNEPHHWGMRDAPDVVFVVAAYLSAYNARAFGVQDYIAQFMFNSPPGLSDAMDLAKMLACLELIEPLGRRDRLPHLPPDTRRSAQPSARSRSGARASGCVDLPSDGAQTAHRARGGPHGSAPRGHRRGRDRRLQGGPACRSRTPWPARPTCGLTRASRARTRTGRRGAASRWMRSAGWARRTSPIPSPIPRTLARAVTSGILDAPHLRNNPFARGQVITRIDRRGACVAVETVSGRPLPEAERLAFLL